ncbi:MAG: beta-lactamase family protein [Spirochaetales bacterium]|nr:beta-lactamase family protein [Spirochaetales bacterium]
MKEYMEWYIEKEMKNNDLVGLSVALLDENEVVWAGNFGMADKASDRQVDENTIFKMGSLSKVFTATAVMQLVEQGLVDLDNPITVYIPEFTYKTRFEVTNAITVRNLMTHHSGLQGDFRKGMMGSEYIPNNFRTTVSLYRDLYAAFPPEQVHAYNNMSVALLGIIIERVSGLDFAEYMKKKILIPLDMDTASFVPLYARKDLDAVAALPYENMKEGHKLFIRNLPAGSLNSSTMDMTHFIQMMLGKGRYNEQVILSESSMAEMYSVQNNHIAFDGGFPQGLNYMLFRDGMEYAGNFAGHNGGTAFFFSSMGVLRDHGLGVVIATNSLEGEDVVDDILNVVLRKALELKTGLTPKRESPPNLTPQQIQAYEGLYCITRFGILDVKVENNNLISNFKGLTVNFIPLGDDWFQLDGKILGLIKIDALDRIKMGIKNIDGKKIVFIKLKDFIYFPMGEEIFPEEISDIWRNRIGKYKLIPESPDFPKTGDMTLKMNNGFLFFEEMGLTLDPKNDNEVIILGFGRGARETITFANIAGKDTITYSGYTWVKK